jgi:hypothetical protein
MCQREYCIFVSMIAYLCLSIALVVASIYGVLLVFNAGIASIDTMSLLCTLNTTKICPKPWHYSSYAEAALSSREIATTLFSVYIGLAILGIVLVVISGAASTGNKQNGYTAV